MWFGFVIILPLMYWLLDALGTFADSFVLETLDEVLQTLPMSSHSSFAVLFALYILNLSRNRNFCLRKRLLNMPVQYLKQQVSLLTYMPLRTLHTLQWRHPLFLHIV